MNVFIRAILSSIKAKITPLVTRLRFFFTPQFWRTMVISKFRQLFSKIFNVRPKDKNDYYGIWRYLVSKRLAYAIVMVIGVLSLVYIVSIWGVLFPNKEGIKTYAYNSFLLRLTNADKVIITGKGGYKAYEGPVKGGAVTGVGQLFDKDNHMVYRGNFQNNKYNGVGTAYYPSGAVKYTGSFAENLYEGEGRLFRESGALEYDGQFVKGMKDGTGKLFNEKGDLVYTGGFSQDGLLYFELVGQSASDVRESYTGQMHVYESDREYCVRLNEIDALYTGTKAEDSVENEIKVDTVYVLKDSFRLGTKEYTSIADITGVLGTPLYHGNSMAILPEAVIIDIMSKYKDTLNGPIDIDLTQRYEEYSQVKSYDRNYPLYLYSFEKDGIMYTFYCKDRDGDFDFYSLTTAGEAAK